MGKPQFKRGNVHRYADADLCQPRTFEEITVQDSHSAHTPRACGGMGKGAAERIGPADVIHTHFSEKIFGDDKRGGKYLTDFRRTPLRALRCRLLRATQGTGKARSKGSATVAARLSAIAGPHSLLRQAGRVPLRKTKGFLTAS